MFGIGKYRILFIKNDDMQIYIVYFLYIFSYTWQN